jgi:hypothetical protein
MSLSEDRDEYQFLSTAARSCALHQLPRPILHMKDKLSIACRRPFIYIIKQEEYLRTDLHARNVSRMPKSSSGAISWVAGSSYTSVRSQNLETRWRNLAHSWRMSKMPRVLIFSSLRMTYVKARSRIGHLYVMIGWQTAVVAFGKVLKAASVLRALVRVLRRNRREER